MNGAAHSSWCPSLESYLQGSIKKRVVEVVALESLTMFGTCHPGRLAYSIVLYTLGTALGSGG
jgi:hypothetical protein